MRLFALLGCFCIPSFLLSMKNAVSPVKGDILLVSSSDPQSPNFPRRKIESPLKLSILADHKSKTLKSGKLLSRKLSFTSDVSDLDTQDIIQDEDTIKKAIAVPVISFLSNKDAIPYHMSNVYKNDDYNNYVMESFVCNQPTVIESMNSAVERGATVNLTVGSHSSNKMDAYKVSYVKRDKNIHCKNIVAFDCSPSKQEPTKSFIMTGSANATDAIWPNGNTEAVVVVENDHELAKQTYNLTRSFSFSDDKNVVKITPTKNMVFSSYKTKLNESRAQRVNNVAQRDGDDRIAWASTMNINDAGMVNALCNAAENGVDTRLTVHKTALTKNGTPLLQKAEEKGVKVNVFFPEEGSRIIHHKKDLITKDLYVSTNANFTDEGDKQKNLETYFPGNTLLVDKAKQDFERVEKTCISLDKALELHVTIQQKKEEKRKQQADNKKLANAQTPKNKKLKKSVLKRKSSSLSGNFESPVKKVKR